MDADLRSFERDLQRDGSPANRLRYARSLERAGRIADAVATLLLAPKERAAREEVGRLTAWNPPGGGSGATFFSDMPAITAVTPREEFAIPPRQDSYAVSANLPMLANAFWALVIATDLRGTNNSLVIVHDLVKAEYKRLLKLPFFARCQLWGDVLLASRSRGGKLITLAKDVPTGKEIWSREELDGVALGTPTLRMVARRTHLESVPIESWREPPGKPSWSQRLALDDDPRSLLVAGGLVLLGAGFNAHAFDVATGKLLWKRPADDVVMLDGAGALLAESDTRLVCVEPGGGTVWTSDAGRCLVLAPSYAILVSRNSSKAPARRLLVIDRRTGETRAEVGGMDRFVACAATSEVFYVACGSGDTFEPGQTVRAFTLDGKALWSLERSAQSLVPLPGRLLCRGREIFCLT